MQLFLVLLHKITHFERIGKMIRGQFSFCSNLYGIFGDFAHKIAEAGSLLRQYEKLVIKIRIWDWGRIRWVPGRNLAPPK